MDLGLENRVAFLTGAANGIGAEVCRTLAKEGTKLAITDINVEKGQALVKEIEDSGGDAIFLKTDVSSYDEVNESVRNAYDHYGQLHIMVHLAGIGKIGKFVQSDPADWKQMVDVLLYGMLNITHVVLPLMIKNNYGKIVNVMGESSKIGESGLSLVAASRAGQPALVKSVAREVGRNNITLNTVSVGVVDTSHYPGGHIEKYREKITANYPVGRIGKPKDVAPMVVFLCSDVSNWITGQVFSVNGGYSMA
ncbi:MAG: SDR family oxidoreductase [Deltaproteobacteria bacterium]|nr:SDR family oxidoreductase [Deltaproteobacteria bacterium]